jgi:hypothetical protein
MSEEPGGETGVWIELENDLSLRSMTGADVRHGLDECGESLVGGLTPVEPKRVATATSSATGWPIWIPKAAG